MVNEKRQLEIFRILVKEMLKKKGLRFDQKDFSRDIGRELKEINDKYKLANPIIKKELIELYLEIMKELTAEHFEMIGNKANDK